MNRLTEAVIRKHADPQSLERGREYYQERAVVSLVKRGDMLQAEVEGSDIQPYSITVTFTPDGDIEAECDCPYDWGGWCKHIVAVLLRYLNEPQEVEERLELAALLSPLDRDSLQSLLLNLVRQKPGLIEEIEREIIQLNRPKPAQLSTPQTATAPSAPPSLPLLNPTSVRKQVRSLLKSIGRGGGGGYDRYDYWDEYDGLEDIEAGISPLLETAEAYTRAGDGRSALPLLEAITEELVESWDRVEDMVSDASDLFNDLGRVWAEAILTADLKPEERRSWAANLDKWRQQGQSSGADDGLETAVEAARQGWDYPPLVRVLQGEITEKGAWEGAVPECADILAEARLNVLERQARWQEAAYLAEAESQYDRYMALLVRLGRAAEAVDFGIDVLTTAEAALALAKTLHEHGETAHAFRISEHGLSLQGLRYPLAIWLRDTATIEGDAKRAIRAAMEAIKETPQRDDYIRLQQLAGERWPQLREEMLAYLRKSRSYDAAGTVDIFLHEGLMEDALAAVRDSWNYDLITRVVEAATPTLPLQVIPICKRQAESIMDAGKADRYHHAARWVARARDAYRAAGQEAEWQNYIAHLLETHQRKYKLVPMLREL